MVIKMKVKIGVSNRHVHLKKEDFEKLFGNIELEKEKDLVQPNEFASKCKLTIKTEKNEIKNVRVLGPFRSYTQIEVSKTDAYTLGINPPVRESGNLENSETVTLVGPVGSIITNGCIIANRHIHISKEEKQKYNLNDIVNVEVKTEKGGIFYNVFLKEKEGAVLEMHIDTDDANANLIKSGDEGEIKQ